jgi:hypothetical protein
MWVGTEYEICMSALHMHVWTHTQVPAALQILDVSIVQGVEVPAGAYDLL